MTKHDNTIITTVSMRLDLTLEQSKIEANQARIEKGQKYKQELLAKRDKKLNSL
jgi:hypothetical protein